MRPSSSKKTKTLTALSKALNVKNGLARTDRLLPSQVGVREPAVAGTFYPADAESLLESIHRCFTHPLGPGHFLNKSINALKEKTECLIVPHAGYEYSGPIAAHAYDVAYNFFNSNREHVSVIIIGPNHYGIGSALAISSANMWKTPLGNIEINKKLSKEILDICNIVRVDDSAHKNEHSIEVQVPFLQVVSRKTEWKLLPISMALQDIDTSRQLGNAITELVLKSQDRFLIIGSSDLTHYEPQSQATNKDLNLLDQAKKMDLMSFYASLENKSITSCGYGAIATVMHVAHGLGKKKATILKYATSGDITGIYTSVVGYPSVRFV